MRNNEYRNFNDFVDAHQVAVFRPKTGFSENWQVALNQAFYEDLSISRNLVFNEYSQERDNRLMGLINDGVIPEHVVAGFNVGRGLDFEALSVWARKNIKTDPEEIPTNKEIYKKIESHIKVSRQHAQDVHSRATTTGMIGQFAGVANAVALDPVLLPTYFVGAGAAAQAGTLLKSTGRAFATVAAAEAVAETAIQFAPGGVYSWKRDIGVDHSVGDAVMQIAAVAGVAGGISATAIALAKGMKKAVNVDMTGTSKTEQYAKKKFLQSAEELETTPPDQPQVLATTHFRGIDETQRGLETRIAPLDESPEVKLSAEERAAGYENTSEAARNTEVELPDGRRVVLGNEVKAAQNSKTEMERLMGCISG